MKVRISIFVFLLLMVLAGWLANPIQPALESYAQTGPGQWAVIIGISDYQYLGEGIPYPAHDASKLAGKLEPIFGKEHVRLLLNGQATKEGVRSAIVDWLSQRAGPGDTVLVFFSGHGAKGGYLLAYDSLRTSTSTTISAYEFDQWLNTLKSKHVAVFLEGCDGADAFSLLHHDGRVLVACSEPGMACFGSVKFGGLFSHYFIESFNVPGTVDSDGNHEISAEEIFSYIRPKVMANSPVGNVQTPVIDDGCKGYLPLFATVTATFDSTPRIAGIFVDGRYYSESSLPVSFTWSKGTEHKVQARDRVDHDGKEVPFSSWSDGSTSVFRQITATESGSYIANYHKQYLLTVISKFGEAQGQRLYNENSTATFSVSPIVDHGDGSRHVFTGWSGDSAMTAPEATIIMDSPKTVVATWKAQYFIELKTYPPNITDLPGGGWYDSGAVISSGTASPIVQSGSGTRYVFRGWNVNGTMEDGNPVSLSVDQSKTAVAEYEKQYELRVQSKAGTPKGSGWYTAGSKAELRAKSHQGFIIRNIFDGWSGATVSTEPRTTLLMDGAKTVTAHWRKDYVQLYILIGIVAALSLAFASVVIVRRRKIHKDYAG